MNVFVSCRSIFSSKFCYILKLPHPSIPSSSRPIPFQTVRMISSSTSKFESRRATLHQVPGVDHTEIDSVADQTFKRYTHSSTSKIKRSGRGVAIVWFRNDLRILDNEALIKAWTVSETVLPVYCVDPRLFCTTYSFGFPKTGALRANFIIECLADLKKNLKRFGLDLMIRHGKPEDILPSVANAYAAHTIYAQRETCIEEVNVEQMVSKNLQSVCSNPTLKLQLLWGTTLYHIDDLPFSARDLPDVYTQFRKSVESKSSIRSCIRLPATLGPAPQVDDWGSVPSIDQLGLVDEKVSKGLAFNGGERASLGRVYEYFWEKDQLKIYKETRNGMLGPDYSTKFSPWLASGTLSPRFIYEEVMRYEKERVSNDSTYWVLFELIWRDYFRFLSIKCGNSLFHQGGPRQLQNKWCQDMALFESWRQGRTGYPLIDANMKELSATGFMSNRGRQIVCSFLVRDMGIDWRMGAEWFETCLLDYDPCSNYGNWTYGAGVGNDPREDRYFSIPKQAQVYDPEGEYVAYWLPELRNLPKDKRHSPGLFYVKPVVPLKYGYSCKQGSQKAPTGAGRQGNFQAKRTNPNAR